MRTEKEIIEAVLDQASKDDTVRAVIRTGLKPVRAFLYQYEFSFVVNDIEKYENDVFSECFGKRILLYRGDKNYPELFPETKAHLMVFEDGITLVINVTNRDTFLEKYRGQQAFENVWMSDTYRKLLDKDGILPDIEHMEEKQTLFSEKPEEAEFSGICSEFWWVMKSLAEYVLREELPAAMFYLNTAVRDLLNRVLRWHIVLQEGQAVDMGILDSNMEKLLRKDLFSLYRRTYPDADYGHIWEAFDAAAELWHKAGSEIGDICGFRYPQDTEEKMLLFIRNLKNSKQTE